jgi:hypothetical protein
MDAMIAPMAFPAMYMETTWITNTSTLASTQDPKLVLAYRTGHAGRRMAEVGNPALVRDGYSTPLDIDCSADTEKELTRCRYSGIKPLMVEWSVFEFIHKYQESREPYD